MRSYIISIGFILFCLSLKGQPIHEGSSIKKINLLKDPYSSPFKNQQSNFSSGRTQKANANSENRLTGYIYEEGITDLKKKSEVKILYTLPNNLSYYYFNEGDSSEMRRYQLGASFEYKYENILSTINPGGVIGYFIRDQDGSIDNDTETLEVKRKINGKWKTTQQIKDKREIPYGFEYGYRYSFLESSPDSWEVSVSGEWKNSEWIATLNAIQVNAQTFAAKEYWRELSRFDEKRHRKEWISYKLINDLYVVQTSFTYKYDEQGREIEKIGEGDYPNPEIKKKWIQAYDEKGNVLLSKFELKGEEWVQTNRTNFERTSEGAWLYTSQRLVSSLWENSYRDKFLYDVADRLIYSSSENWDKVEQKWNLSYESKSKYYAGDLVAEIEYYSTDQNQYTGQRWKATYDENKKLKFTETFICYDLDCQQAKFSPTYKAYYENKDNADYFTSYYYTADRWVRFDSVANRYSEKNEIVEGFWCSYEGSYPEQIRAQLRYKFNYEIFVLTETEQENHIGAYPNPVHSLLYLDHVGSQVLITDLAGKQIANVKIEISQNGMSTINMSDFEPGMYFLKYSDGDGKIRIQKIVKQ
jgi:hypothetical protein